MSKIFPVAIIIFIAIVAFFFLRGEQFDLPRGESVPLEETNVNVNNVDSEKENSLEESQEDETSDPTELKGHSKSEYSTIVTVASGLPRMWSESSTGRRFSAEGERLFPKELRAPPAVAAVLLLLLLLLNMIPPAISIPAIMIAPGIKRELLFIVS